MDVAEAPKIFDGELCYFHAIPQVGGCIFVLYLSLFLVNFIEILSIQTALDVEFVDKYAIAHIICKG